LGMSLLRGAVGVSAAGHADALIEHNTRNQPEHRSG
jgi:hypothetical protein